MSDKNTEQGSGLNIDVGRDVDGDIKVGDVKTGANNNATDGSSIYNTDSGDIHITKNLGLFNRIRGGLLVPWFGGTTMVLCAIVSAVVLAIMTFPPAIQYLSKISQIPTPQYEPLFPFESPTRPTTVDIPLTLQTGTPTPVPASSTPVPVTGIVRLTSVTQGDLWESAEISSQRNGIRISSDVQVYICAIAGRRTLVASIDCHLTTPLGWIDSDAIVSINGSLEALVTPSVLTYTPTPAE